MEGFSMQPEAREFTTTIGGREVKFSTGKLAGQAGGAVTVQLGDSIVFAAATMGAPREGIDFFPLTVEYEERMYAGGRIPGSFFRREGRPSTSPTSSSSPTSRPRRRSWSSASCANASRT
jgi:polyribonucleotide nucleotidyltransferase